MGLRMFAALTLAAVALAGCNPATTDEPADPVAKGEARGEVGGEAVAAEAFVRSLYAGQASTDIDATAPIWSARTAALLARTEALTEEGDQGFFEADPICDCQDGEARLLDLTTTLDGPDRADVLAAYDYGGADARVWSKTYRLVREEGAWKIDDIDRDQTVENPEKPLVQSLDAWIAEAQGHSAP